MHEAPSPVLRKLLKFNESFAEKYGAIPADIRHPTLAEDYTACEVQKANREAWDYVRSMSDN